MAAAEVAQQMERLSVQPKRDVNRKIKAVEWHGKKTVEVRHRPFPLVTDPMDALIRVTSTAICGSDLHLFHNSIMGMERGDVLGHEFMGIVEDVGSEVSNVKPGDRVVVSFDIACGRCFFCSKGLFSCCDTTNPTKEQEKLYGHRTAGIFGYTHMTGGYDGGQAEYVRVPFADVNLLKVPDALTDEQVLFLSDILPTAWHANELGGVQKGDNVAIWGAGPVGILAAHCAKHRGAERVVLIDREEYRLEHARKKIPGIETINFTEKKPVEVLKEKFVYGPDVVIEAVGVHYAKSLTHKVEMTLGLETDTSEILNELIMCVRKGGRISDVGVYAGFCNGYNIGAFMEKGLTMRAGQTPVQFYWKYLLGLIEKQELDPTIVLTHVLPLEEAAKGYELFDDKKDNCIKVILKPEAEWNKHSKKVEEVSSL